MAQPQGSDAGHSAGPAARSPRHLGPMSPARATHDPFSHRPDYGASPSHASAVGYAQRNGYAPPSAATIPVLPSPARAFQPLGGSGGAAAAASLMTSSSTARAKGYEDLVMPTSYAHSIRSSARMEVGSPGVYVPPSGDSLGRSPARAQYHDAGYGRGSGAAVGSSMQMYGSGGYMPSPPAARPVVDRLSADGGGRGRRLVQGSPI